MPLLNKIGPTVLVGHSIGGALAFKVAERVPEQVRAIVALAPASGETRKPAIPPAPPGKSVAVTREGAQQRFANTERFPAGSFDDYFASLVPYAPRIHDAAVGVSDELKIDRTRLNIWKRVPILFLTAEDDRTVSAALSDEKARVMNIPYVKLGRDWGLKGHGHL